MFWTMRFELFRDSLEYATDVSTTDSWAASDLPLSSRDVLEVVAGLVGAERHASCLRDAFASGYPHETGRLAIIKF